LFSTQGSGIPIFGTDRKLTTSFFVCKPDGLPAAEYSITRKSRSSQERELQPVPVPTNGRIECSIECEIGKNKKENSECLEVDRMKVENTPAAGIVVIFALGTPLAGTPTAHWI